MRPLVRTTSLLVILLLAVTPVLGKELRIVGQVTDALNIPPTMGHIHLVDALDPAALDTLEPLARKGKFKLVLTRPGLYMLRIAAPGHDGARIPITVTPEGGELELKVQLARFPYSPDPTKLAVIGDWNDFSFQQAELMERGEDGSFTYQVQGEPPLIAYQLIGMLGQGRAVESPQADRYEYDGEGHYRSVILTNTGQATLKLNAVDLPRDGRVGTSKVVFRGQVGNHVWFWDLESRLEDAFRRLASPQFAGAEPVPTEEVLGSIPMELRDMLFDDQSPEGQLYAATRLVRIAPLVKLERGTAWTLLEKIPASSPFWTPESGAALLSLTGSLGAEGAERTLQRFRENSPHPYLQGLCLAEMVTLAERAGNLEVARLRYTEFMDRFGQIPELRYHRIRVNPDRVIAAGKPIPAFSIGLIGEERTATHESLRGSYLLIDFWATWCSPCLEEMDVLHQAQQQFSPQGLQTLSLSFDRSRADLEQFRQGKWKMPWMHAFVEGGFQSDLARAFEVVGIPRPILVGPDGTILAEGEDLSGERLLETLERLVVPVVPAAPETAG